MPDVDDLIIQIAADMSGRAPTEITSSTRLAEDLRIKSANRMEILARLEDELGVVLTVSDVLRAKTIGDLAGLARARAAPH